MRDGNPGVCRRCDPSGYSGDDLEGDVRRGERLRLLAPPTEDERVAPLEPDDALARLRQPNEQRADLALARGIAAAAAFADVVLFRFDANEKRWIRQRVVHDRIATGKEVAAANGDETRISRAGAHDTPCRGERQPVRFHLPPVSPARAPAVGRGRVGRASREPRQPTSSTATYA
jgi:hypothetical protein